MYPFIYPNDYLFTKNSTFAEKFCNWFIMENLSVEIQSFENLCSSNYLYMNRIDIIRRKNSGRKNRRIPKNN
jgi:hypothetical protein